VANQATHTRLGRTEDHYGESTMTTRAKMRTSRRVKRMTSWRPKKMAKNSKMTRSTTCPVRISWAATRPEG